MAKKKQGRGSSSNGGSDEADKQPQQEDQQQQLEQEASGEVPAAAVEQQQAVADDDGIQELSVEQLRAELAAARAEIQQLRAELAVKSDQRDVVKPSSSSSTHDVQELQEKLARLRKEQQAADAARDKAWQQLKAVVEEISSLANPDYLQSVQIRPHD